MKPIFMHAAGAVALTATVAACSFAPAPALLPAPVQQAPAPAPTLVTAQATAPVVDQWIDAPRTPGDWTYRTPPGATWAEYGEGTNRLFALHCDRARRQVSLERAAAQATTNQITVRTESRTIALSAHPASDGTVIVATLDSRDPLLDAMAITRGRFSVEVAGYPALYLPNWAEVAKVVEDCRE